MTYSALSCSLDVNCCYKNSALPLNVSVKGSVKGFMVPELLRLKSNVNHFKEQLSLELVAGNAKQEHYEKMYTNKCLSLIISCTM